MKVLFVHPKPPPSVLILQKLTYHYGIGILSAVLKKHGHETDLLTLHKLEKKKIQKQIQEFNPDLVGITVTSNQFELSEKITAFIHTEFEVPVVWGGVHPSVRPEECIRVPGVLGICLGEAEESLLEFVDILDKKNNLEAGDLNIQNFWFNHNGRVIKNPIRPLLQDLNSLPFCDREIIDFQKLLDYHQYLEIRSSRGCPFHCSFCVNSSYQELYRGKGRYYRVRSHESVLDEIEDLVNRYKHINSIIFDDELISVNKKWTLGLLEKYKQRFDFPFNITVRADLVTEDFIKALKEAGCNMVMMGVENGDETIRNEVLDKGISDDQIIKAARIIKDTGIHLWSFNMVGVPFETPETVEKTIALNKRIKPDIVFVSVFYPYPGTKLGALCEEMGWISDRKIPGFFSNITVLDQPSITKEQVAYYHNIFPWAIMYPRLAPLIKWMNRLRLGRKSVYDWGFPVVKSVYEIYHRSKLTLNLLPARISCRGHKKNHRPRNAVAEEKE
jgi:anaerobic magnesium-protoporphyrin IX monomethyl ester cyclase